MDKEHIYDHMELMLIALEDRAQIELIAISVGVRYNKDVDWADLVVMIMKKQAADHIRRDDQGYWDSGGYPGS